MAVQPRPRLLRAWLIVTLLLGGCGDASTTVITTSTSPAGTASSAPTGLQQSFVTVIGRVTPMVVQISTPQVLGSGVVFDSNGDVVTNAHVVAGGAPLQVTDSRGHSYHATVVGAFAPDDLAVVRAQGARLPSAVFAGSDAMQVGDIVLAIGNPLGLRSSVTEGSSARSAGPSTSPPERYCRMSFRPARRSIPGTAVARWLT